MREEHLRLCLSFEESYSAGNFIFWDSSLISKICWSKSERSKKKLKSFDNFCFLFWFDNWKNTVGSKAMATLRLRRTEKGAPWKEKNLGLCLHVWRAGKEEKKLERGHYDEDTWHYVCVCLELEKGHCEEKKFWDYVCVWRAEKGAPGRKGNVWLSLRAWRAGGRASRQR